MNNVYSKLCFLSALIIGQVTGGSAVAEVNFSECHQLEGDSERLACYDSASGWTATSAEEEVEYIASEDSGAQWQYNDEKSSLDGRKDVWLRVWSNNSQSNQIGSPEKAVFYVRCMNNSTNVFVEFNSYTTEDQNVRYRLDEGGVSKVWMQTMNGGDGIGIWSGRSAIPFAKKLLDNKKLVIAYNSYSNHNLEFVFDIGGLRNQLSPLAESCQWEF